MSTTPTGPYEALKQARLRVDELMWKSRAANGMWLETSATQVLLTTAWPRVDYQEFKASEETENGADWLWWWLDSDGTCYGILVQAKNLKIAGTRRYTVDFGYKTKNDERLQIAKLIKTADEWKVPAAYMLYCGDTEYRSKLECDRTHPAGSLCRDRDRAGVAAVSALVAQTAVGLYGAQSGVAAFHDAVPVEDIASPDGIDAPIVPLARGLSGDLERFLRDPQRGSRRVAKEMLRPVQQIRNGQFAGAAVMGRANQVAGALFQDVPSDHGHFTVPYLAHVLRGLRTEIPSYVRDILEGRTPPTWVAERLGGIVVITDADAPSTALSESRPNGVPQGPLLAHLESDVPDAPGKAA
ncbi:hypothetical protein [Streptomyces sp. DH7]|uniref:hypothetical protein n=1 Tax=Streptomyces sp. DH7 TaxID=2857006 RepID=UPI001E2D2EE1|nr:hypothetical protein [Streptomyces sp. DH7]